MSELDSVNDAIRSHIVESALPADALANPLQHTIIDGLRRFQERFLEKHRVVRAEDTEVHEAYEAGKKQFDDIGDDIQTLVESLPADKDKQIEAFQALARRALVARRSTYDLTNRERPWEELTPEEAIEDPDDAYTWGLVDTLVDKIERIGEPEEDEDDGVEAGEG